MLLSPICLPRCGRRICTISKWPLAALRCSAVLPFWLGVTPSYVKKCKKSATILVWPFLEPRTKGFLIIIINFIVDQLFSNFHLMQHNVLEYLESKGSIWYQYFYTLSVDAISKRHEIVINCENWPHMSVFFLPQNVMLSYHQCLVHFCLLLYWRRSQWFLCFFVSINIQ